MASSSTTNPDNESPPSGTPSKDGGGTSPSTSRRQERRRYMLMKLRMMLGDPFGDDADDLDAFSGDDEDLEEEMMWMMMHGRSWRHYKNKRKEKNPYQNKEDAQRTWMPPRMVKPESAPQMEVEEDVEKEDVGVVSSDAHLYTLEEEKEEGEKQMHYVMKMPSVIPESLQVSEAQPTTSTAYNTYNILMADVSGSMSSYWNQVVVGWNKHVAPVLVGRTDVYVFGSDVKLVRSEPTLANEDFLSGMTDLTGALQTIVDKVYTCKEYYVKVFIITDGSHTETHHQPERVIEVMRDPKGKMCDVYLLGAGRDFPVQYSVDIRSRLHNGSANLPTIFWANETIDIDTQMADIGRYLSGKSEFTLGLSSPGYKLPGGAQKSIFHVNEWVYFDKDPEKDGGLTVSSERAVGRLDLPRSPISTTILMEAIRQWNGVAIQHHNKRIGVPKELIPLMERLFMTQIKSATEGTGIAKRLARIQFKTIEVEFRTNLNKVKEILTTQKFADNIKLAESILSTTVTSNKYNAKLLKLKGHTDVDYEQDCKDFTKVYETVKEALKGVTVTPEDCCRITMTSTISDLQDDDFLMMLKLDKFEFLRQFTISGIPVFAPTRDSVGLNPWSYSIRGILKSPYTTLSQVALENFASQEGNVGEIHKDIQLKPDDPNTHFNAIIPIFNPAAAHLMGPIVETKLFAMCATYAILKNPHYIDFNIHLAALVACWVRILFENPELPRPEYVQQRVEAIFATAALYIKRKSYQGYCNLLIDDTPKALMTESTVTVNQRPVKCETLIKPMFMLYLMKQKQNLDEKKVVEILRFILLEYVGRCLSRKDGDLQPFTDCFVENFSDPDKKKEWLQGYIKESTKELSTIEANLLPKFYSFEEAQKSARKETIKHVNQVRDQLKEAFDIKVNMQKVERMRNVNLAGDVSWPTLRTYARDLGLSAEAVDELFGEKNVLVYLQHALRYKNSRERLEANVDSYEDAFKLVKLRVQEENMSMLGKELKTELVNLRTNRWLSEYYEAHSGVVRPMSKQQILAVARERGIDVTEETFDQVYRKYRPHLGLLSNACQMPTCPYYLQPNRRYNQHAIVERRRPVAFPHGFHQVAYDCRSESIDLAIEEVQHGTHRKHSGVGQTLPLESISELRRELEQLKNIYMETGSC